MDRSRAPGEKGKGTQVSRFGWNMRNVMALR